MAKQKTSSTPRQHPRDDVPASEPARFNALPTFKLDVLSSITSKHGEQLYQRMVGLRITECRILGVVAHFGPVTLRQTCVEVGIDKGQGSRLVSKLLASGLLDRRDDPVDQRSFYLLLTPPGRKMHARIAAAAAARNEHWMRGLPADKRSMFAECMDLLTLHTQRMLIEENTRSLGVVKPLPIHEQAEPASAVERPLVVAPEVLRDLQRRLGDLLGDC